MKKLGKSNKIFIFHVYLAVFHSFWEIKKKKKPLVFVFILISSEFAILHLLTPLP